MTMLQRKTESVSILMVEQFIDSSTLTMGSVKIIK